MSFSHTDLPGRAGGLCYMAFLLHVALELLSLHPIEPFRIPLSLPGLFFLSCQRECIRFRDSFLDSTMVGILC